MGGTLRRWDRQVDTTNGHRTKSIRRDAYSRLQDPVARAVAEQSRHAAPCRAGCRRPRSRSQRETIAHGTSSSMTPKPCLQAVSAVFDTDNAGTEATGTVLASKGTQPQVSGLGALRAEDARQSALLARLTRAAGCRDPGIAGCARRTPRRSHSPLLATRHLRGCHGRGLWRVTLGQDTGRS
jgi:hypothetical protein